MGVALRLLILHIFILIAFVVRIECLRW